MSTRGGPIWREDGQTGYTAGVRRARCPTCHREAQWQDNPYRPFCSERCKVLDLAAWADERYRIPGETVSQEPELPGTEPGRDRS